MVSRIDGKGLARNLGKRIGLSAALSLAAALPAAAQSSGGRPAYNNPPAAGSGSAGQPAPPPASGARSAAPAGSGFGSASQPPAAGSGSAMAGSGGREPMVAMQGFCPVCVVEIKQWKPGSPQFASVVDGKKYLFPDPGIKATFDANPGKYLPALGGDDVVTYAQTGRRQPGSLAFGVLHGGRSYFFTTDANKRQFMASPASFASADLALGGDCVVCRVDMQQAIPGQPSTTLVREGLRFQFMGPQQQQAFLAAPSRYVSAAAAAGPSAAAVPAGSATQPGSAPRPGSGSGGSQPPAGSGAQQSGSAPRPAGSGSQPAPGSGTL